MHEEKSSNNSRGRLFIIIVVALGLATIIGLFVYSGSIDKDKKVDVASTEVSSEVSSGVGSGDYPDYNKIQIDKNPTGYDLERQPMIGDEDALVTLVEFGDYRCPPCKAWSDNVYPQLYKEYIKTGKVKMYFINYQFLSPQSLLAGTAGEIIYKQNPDAFWQYHTEMYKHLVPKETKSIDQEYLVNFVKENVDGINVDKFAKDLKDLKYFDEVKIDYENAKLLGVDSTPTIHVNGEKVYSNYSNLTNYIDKQYAEIQ